MGDSNKYIEQQEELSWLKSWIDTRCEDVPIHKFLYKIMCIITGRRKKKFTYKDIYILLCNINRKKNKEEQKKVQTNSLEQIIKIYQYNNGDKNDK